MYVLCSTLGVGVFIVLYVERRWMCCMSSVGACILWCCMPCVVVCVWCIVCICVRY